MDYVLGFLFGSIGGVIFGFIAVYFYGMYKIRQFIANAGEHATGFVQTNIAKAVSKYQQNQTNNKVKE